MPPPEGSLLLVVHTTRSKTTLMCTTMGILSSTKSMECKIFTLLSAQSITARGVRLFVASHHNYIYCTTFNIYYHVEIGCTILFSPFYQSVVQYEVSHECARPCTGAPLHQCTKLARSRTGRRTVSTVTPLLHPPLTSSYSCSSSFLLVIFDLNR